MKLKAYNENELVYSPFSSNQEVFLIETGFVFAFTYEDSGIRRIHLVYGPGHFFPILSTFKGSPQRASYETLTKAKLQTMSQPDFIKKLEDQTFCRQILDKTVDQLAIFAERVIDLQTTSLEDRVMLRLRSLCRECGVEETEPLPYKLSHYHLADMLGVERESVTRALTRLKSKKLVESISDGRLRVV